MRGDFEKGFFANPDPLIAFRHDQGWDLAKMVEELGLPWMSEHDLARIERGHLRLRSTRALGLSLAFTKLSQKYSPRRLPGAAKLP